MATKGTRYHATIYGYLGLYPLVVALFAFSGQDLVLAVPLAFMVAPTGLIARELMHGETRGWYALVAHTVLVTFTGGLTALSSERLAPAALAISGLAVLIGAMFAHPDARKPFLSESRRGIRRHKRKLLALPVTVVAGVRSVTAETYDLSEGGAYIQVNTAGHYVGEKIALDLHTHSGARIWLTARVRSVNASGMGAKPPGLGVELIALSRADVRALRHLLATTRQHERTYVALPVRISSGNVSVEATTHDVSVGGCYTTPSSSTRLSPGEKVSVELELHEGDYIETLAEVVWSADLPTRDKPEGMALRFIGLSSRDELRIRQRLAEKDVVHELRLAA